MKKSFMFLVFAFFAAALACGQSITVTAPNGGESWTLGTLQEITWSSQGCTGNVRINLVKAGGGVFATIAVVPVVSGCYSWTVGQTNLGQAPAGGYRIELSVPSQDPNQNVDDQSDTAFSILWNPAIPLSAAASTSSTSSITVNAPNGGERWVRGTKQDITWTSSGCSSSVRIELLRSDGGVYGTIAVVPVGNGCYSWAVGETSVGLPPAGDFRIRLHVHHQNVEDQSDGVFKIIMPLTPASFPDLKISIGCNPESPAIFENTAIKFTVKNIGQADAQPCALRVYMGTTKTDQWSIPTLKPGRDYSMTKNLNPPKVGYIMWKGTVDEDKFTSDPFRANNIAIKKMIIKGPDLKILSISTPDYKKTIGQKCIMRAIVKNIGHAPSGRFELDCDWDYCPGIARGREFKVNDGLAPGQEVTYEFTHRYACFGNHFPRLHVDKANQVEEENERNNECGACFHVDGRNITGNSPKTFVFEDK